MRLFRDRELVVDEISLVSVVDARGILPGYADQLDWLLRIHRQGV